MKFVTGNRIWPAVLPMLLAAPARAEEAGLPQLDTTLFPEQLFWLAISFAVLYVMMSVVALPRVAKTQDNRKTIIASELAAAKAASEAAKAASAMMDKSLDDARSAANASVSDMVAKVAAESQERQSVQEKDLLRKLRSAEEQIAVTRAAALKAVGAEQQALAGSIVEKILGRRAA